MYIDDFVRLCRQHQAPSAELSFLSSRFGRSDTLSIMDFKYLQREGVAPVRVEAEQHTDYWRDSFICNVASINGEIPMKSIVEPTQHRGVIDALKLLLQHGCLVPSKDLTNILGENSQKYAVNMNRMHYVA